MIKHVHYDFQNNKFIMRLYVKYKDFLSDDYKFINKLSIDSTEVVYAVISFEDNDNCWKELLDSFLDIKGKLTKAASISVSDSIHGNLRLSDILQDMLSYANECETNEEYL